MGRLGLPLGLAAALAVAACTPTLPELNAEQQWTSAVRRLGLLPFYPLQEDVQIGDVFLLAPSAENGAASDDRFDLVRLGGLTREDVIDELRQHGERRVRFGERPPEASPDTRPRQRASAQPQAQGGRGRPTEVADPARRESDVRLRQVALPAITVARITEGQLTGSGFLGNVGAALGIGGTGSVALTITLDDTSETSIDASRAQEFFQSRRLRFVKANMPPDTMLAHIRQLRPDLLEAFCTADLDALNAANVSVVVVNRVVYARKVDYEFASQSAFAVQLAANLTRVFGAESGAPQLPGPAGGSGQVPARGEGGTEGNASRQGNPGGERPPVPRPADATAATRTLLGSLSRGIGPTGGEPAARASFGIGRSGNLALKEEFSVPMAVGTGTYFRFPLGDVIRIWAEIPDTDRVGHGFREVRATMVQARNDTLETCRELAKARRWRAGEGGVTRLEQAMAHVPRENTQEARSIIPRATPRATSAGSRAATPLPPLPQQMRTTVQR